MTTKVKNKKPKVEPKNTVELIKLKKVGFGLYKFEANVQSDKQQLDLAYLLEIYNLKMIPEVVFVSETKSNINGFVMGFATVSDPKIDVKFDFKSEMKPLLDKNILSGSISFVENDGIKQAILVEYLYTDIDDSNNFSFLVLRLDMDLKPAIISSHSIVSYNRLPDIDKEEYYKAKFENQNMIDQVVDDLQQLEKGWVLIEPINLLEGGSKSKETKSGSTTKSKETI